MNEDTEKREGRADVAPSKVSGKVSSRRRTRRKAGHGAVIHRKDGRWVGRLRLEDGTVRLFYRHSQDEAEAALAEALQTLDQGLPLPGAWSTFLIRSGQIP